MGRSWEEVFPREPVMRIVIFCFFVFLFVFFFFFLYFFLGEGEVGVWIDEEGRFEFLWCGRYGRKSKSEKCKVSK